MDVAVDGWLKVLVVWGAVGWPNGCGVAIEVFPVPAAVPDVAGWPKGLAEAGADGRPKILGCEGAADICPIELGFDGAEGWLNGLGFAGAEGWLNGLGFAGAAGCPNGLA